MKRNIFLAFLLGILLSNISTAQNFSINTSYQLGKNGEYYGISASKWIKAWNNDKVVLKGTAGFFLGSHWGEKVNISKFNRVELGIESRNMMVTGKDFFNILNVSYSFTSYSLLENNNLLDMKKNGWMFSFGFGTKIISPAAFTARYIWGLQSGIRLGLEYDL